MPSRLDFVTPLFVPANRPDRFVKAAASLADAIILDLEDAVAIDAKNAARDALRADFSDKPILVRINGAGTPWHDDDLAAVSRLPVTAVLVPKAEDPASLARIVAAMGPERPLVALVESATGLAAARALGAGHGIARLAFGSIDYCADLGCAHTPNALLTARSELVLASRLAGLPAPLDGVTAAISDAGAAREDARHAAELGFGGKLAIHPHQVAPILEGFLPTAAEVTWAEKVLASADGAVAVDGAMVDEPVRARARTLLRRQSAAFTGLSPVR